MQEEMRECKNEGMRECENTGGRHTPELSISVDLLNEA